MAENIQAVLLLAVLFLSGLALLFNVPAMLGLNLGLGFNQISGFMSGFWIIMLRLVGLVLAIISAWVIVNIIREG